jgi:hypothetical protein
LRLAATKKSARITFGYFPFTKSASSFHNSIS